MGVVKRPFRIWVCGRSGASSMQIQDSVTDELIRFNSILDVEGAASVFAERRRVRIADTLDPLSATRLHGSLKGEVPWRLTYYDGKENVFLDAASLQQLGEQGRHELLRGVLASAQDNFQYLFRSYPMVTGYLQGEDPELFLHHVFEWLNDSRTLNVMRRITGIKTLAKVNAQATLYHPGHFLIRHDDSGHPEQRRRVAYVLNMTRDWRPDWGGQLQFLSPEGEVEEVWLPRFNSLALFTVPTPHLVSYVAPFATQPRYAITGWLCDA